MFSQLERARATLSLRLSQGFSSISVDAAEYYNCSEITINTLVTVGNFAQILVALIWTMNLESTYGLQIPYVVGVTLLFVGGWLSYIGATGAACAGAAALCGLLQYTCVVGVGATQAVRPLGEGVTSFCAKGTS